MKKVFPIIFLTACTLVACFQPVYAQKKTKERNSILHLKSRAANALSGSEFALKILPDALDLTQREQLIFDQVKLGNVPDFYWQMIPITDSMQIDGKTYKVLYHVAADYLAIGSNSDYFYISPTPALAQRIADLLHCKLPTRKMVNDIYLHATIKLEPQPIPPSMAMTTVPVFLKHNGMVAAQLELLNKAADNRSAAELVAGNKKDVVVSNKIYGETTKRVVIYGWHKTDGKAIQPLYNKHIHTWADYSHGMRLVSDVVYVNDKKTSIKKLLKDPALHVLLSDEGSIANPSYPIQ